MASDNHNYFPSKAVAREAMSMGARPQHITRRSSRTVRRSGGASDASCLSFLLLVSIPLPCIFAQNTCEFDGQVFQAGQPLGDRFTSRCGSAEDFPCFCAPERSPPVDCPFCGIASLSNEENLACALVDGPSIRIINFRGQEEECYCQRDQSGNPESICFPPGTVQRPPTQAPNENNINTDDPNDDVCVLEWDDGSVDTFQDGESFGELFETGCGPPVEYPCFCNVSLPTKLYCPYCSIESLSGYLECAGIGDTFEVTNTDNEQLSCFCQGNLEADCTPIADLTPAPDASTPVPTAAASDPATNPVPTLDASPTPLPTVRPSPNPVPDPTRRPTLPTPVLDKPSLLLPSRTPPVSLPVQGCTFFDSDGTEQFVEKGEVISILEGPCTPHSSYPVLCHPDLPGMVEYPYCIFAMDAQSVQQRQQQASSESDFFMCAKNGDQISVPTSDGNLATCTCLYLNSYVGAVSSCPDLIMGNLDVPTLTASPTTAPTPWPTRENQDNDNLENSSPVVADQDKVAKNNNDSSASSLRTGWKLFGALMAITWLAA